MGHEQSRAITWLGRAPLVLLPLLVLSIWFVAFRPASLGGPVRYVIIEGQSMEPTLSSGDLVLTRVRDEYEVGDVISFETPIGPVMHRIIGGDAEAGYISQGDNNRRPDPWHTDRSQISGELWLSLPYGQHLRWLGPVTLSLSSAFFGILGIAYVRGRRQPAEPGLPQA